MLEFKSSLQAVWWVVETQQWVRGEELSQNTVASFRNLEKQFCSCSLFWQNMQLDFTLRWRYNRRILIKHFNKNFLNIREVFIFDWELSKELYGAESFELILIFSVSTWCYLVSKIEFKSLDWLASSLITTKKHIKIMFQYHIVWLCSNVSAPVKQLKFCLYLVSMVNY